MGGNEANIPGIDNSIDNISLTMVVYASCLILLTYCYNNMFMLIPSTLLWGQLSLLQLVAGFRIDRSWPASSGFNPAQVPF